MAKRPVVEVVPVDIIDRGVDGPVDSDADLHVVAGAGWKRGLVGFAVGAAAGIAAALVLPRDEGPRRTPR